MKKHRLIVALLAITVFAIVTTQSQVASAKAVKTPTSLRGTWYHYDDAGYSKLRVTKYHFKSSGAGGTTNLSGVKYPKYANGHAQLTVHRTKKGNYIIGSYASDEWPSWRRVTHKKHAALRELSYTLPGPVYYSDYWYKSRKIARHPTPQPKKVKFKTARSSDFFYDSWQPAFLDQSTSELDLFTKKSDVSSLNDPDKTVTDPLTKMSAKWVSKSQSDDIILVKLGGSTYYADDSDHVIRPYNAFRDDGIIGSFFSPNSKNVMLKHGQHIYKGSKWMRFLDLDFNKSKDYQFNGKKWVKW